MRFIDIIKICFSNLWRRKMRTSLTILGVFIGIFSILATVSIGLALNYNLDQSLENIYGVRVINITGFNYQDMDSQNGNRHFSPGRNNADEDKLNDATIAKLRKVQGVAAVTPSLNLEFFDTAKSPNDFNFQAVNPEIIPFYTNRIKGENLTPDDSGILIHGGQYLSSIGIYPTWDDVNKVEIKPTLSPEQQTDLLKKSLKFTMKNPWMSRRESDQIKPKIIYPELKLKVHGVILDYGWNGNSFISFKTGMKLIDDLYKKNAGKKDDDFPYFVQQYKQIKKEKIYPTLLVGVEKFEDVKPVIKKLKELHYEVYSEIDMFEMQRKFFSYVQMVLGGLGAISLLVATIGITNTTVMTIYERTKEIGIMKVIGANLTDIRNLFLFESGLIGFFGGLVGVAVAKIISIVANHIAKNLPFLNEISGGDSATENLISYLPLWVIILTLIISTCIGLMAGYFPSRRAMKMSALDSLRAE